MKNTGHKLEKCIFPFLVITLLITFVYLSACNNAEPGLGIYLVDSGELVLSDQHIEAYYWGSHTIELNEKGIEKWNSYMTYGGIPKIQETLHQRDFMLKVKGEEIYRGKFYSMVSSMSYEGVVILDSIIKLDKNINTIIIQHGYPSPGVGTGEDPRNNQKVYDYLESKGLLKPGEKWLFE